MLLIIISNAAVSEEHAAHIHGQAALNIAIEKNSVYFSFIAPAESLLGFEHTAVTSAELAKIALLKTYLSQPFNIIQFHGGECQIEHTEIDTGDVSNKEEHAHKSSHANSHAHAEITVNHQLNCQNTNEFSSATLTIFEHYNALKRVKTRWINSSGQGAETLEPRNRHITLH